MENPLPTARNSSWAELGACDLDRDSWQRLVRNEVPAVVIRGFAHADECARLVERSEAIGFAAYRGVVPAIDRVGVTVFEHNGAPPSSYFAEAERARGVQSQVFAESFSPLERLMSRLREVTGTQVQVAVDPQRGTYYAGLIRRIENGTLLHIDYAPVEQPDWWVAQVQEQLSWNLYLELDPLDPGDTRVYRRAWRPGDDELKLDGSYGYDRAVVDGADRFTLRPTARDVYVFNTRNFHEVDPSRHRRTTVTSAIGVLRDGRIVLWS